MPPLNRYLSPPARTFRAQEVAIIPSILLISHLSLPLSDAGASGPASDRTMPCAAQASATEPTIAIRLQYPSTMRYGAY